MKKPEPELSLVIKGLRTLKEEKNAVEFFKLLRDAGQEFLPQKIGYANSMNIPVNDEAITKFWIQRGIDFKKNTGFTGGGGVDFKGKSGYWGAIGWHQEGSNHFSLYIPISYFEKIGAKSLLNFVQRVFEWCDGDYGYAYHSSQGRVQYTPGISYRTCLGGITWMALFGPPYVEMFGREVLQSAPCVVEEFAENRFMLLTSEEPVEPTPEILERQAMVRKHLGEDAFYRHEEEAKRPKSFTMEEARAGLDLPNKEGYRHPDFSKYLPGYKEDDTRVICQVEADGTAELQFIKPKKN